MYPNIVNAWGFFFDINTFARYGVCPSCHLKTT